MCGTFSVNADIDTRHIIAPLGFAQDILQRSGQVSRVELVPGPSWSPEELRESIDARWPEELLTRTRREKNALIHSTSRAEKWATRLPSSASSSSWPHSTSSAALTVLLLDKRRDIGTLSAIGTTPKDIRRVFSWQGFLINAVGATAGLAIGLTLVWLQDRFGLVRLQGATVPAYPVARAPETCSAWCSRVLGVGGTFSAAMVAYLVRRTAPDAA